MDTEKATDMVVGAMATGWGGITGLRDISSEVFLGAPKKWD